MNKLAYHTKTIVWMLALLSMFAADAARAWLSIVMILFVLVHILEELFVTKPKERSIHASMFRNLSISFVLIYLLQLFSVSHWDNYLQRLQVHAPFIVLPLVLMYARPLHIEQTKKIILVFISALSVVSIFMLVLYVLDFAHYNQIYAQSQVIPGPISHIRLSLMVSFGAYLTYYMLYHVGKFSNIMRKLLWFQLVLLVLFCHIYAVRGGMLALYTLALYEVTRYFYTKGFIKYILASWFVCIILGMAVSLSVPTLRNKLVATIEDLQQYNQGMDLNHNSLGKRIVSYQIAWELFKENPLSGSGISNYHELNMKRFAQLHPEVQVPILAHNQFLYWLAATGLLGLLIFCMGFFYPLIKLGKCTPKLLIAHLLLLFVSFQTEPMLETQLGVSYSIWFWLLPLAMQPLFNPE